MTERTGPRCGDGGSRTAHLSPAGWVDWKGPGTPVFSKSVSVDVHVCTSAVSRGTATAWPHLSCTVFEARLGKLGLWVLDVRARSYAHTVPHCLSRNVYHMHGTDYVSLGGGYSCQEGRACLLQLLLLMHKVSKSTTANHVAYFVKYLTT